jgi:hypothetical protein
MHQKGASDFSPTPNIVQPISNGYSTFLVE